MSVLKKLMQARLELQATKLNKSGHNKFADYDYFELADFLPVVQQIFAKHGLCGVVSYAEQGASLTITSVEDNISVSICSPMAEAHLKGCHPIQNLGAVQTYLRRYLWVTAMEIVEHDALDATTGIEKSKNEEETPSKSITPNSAGRDFWDAAEPDEKEFLNKCLGTIRDLLNSDEPKKAADFFYGVGDTEEMAAVWAQLTPGERKIIKAQKESAK